MAQIRVGFCQYRRWQSVLWSERWWSDCRFGESTIRCWFYQWNDEGTTWPGAGSSTYSDRTWKTYPAWSESKGRNAYTLLLLSGWDTYRICTSWQWKCRMQLPTITFVGIKRHAHDLGFTAYPSGCQQTFFHHPCQYFPWANPSGMER